MAFDSGKTGAQVLAGLMPTGGTDGQALRKLGASAEWSAYWVVDPTTGAMSSTLPDDATPITPSVTTIPLMLSVEAKLTDANVGDGPGIDRNAVLKISKAGSFSLTTNSDYYGILPSTQNGYSNTQSGNYGTQSGDALNDGGFSHTAMFGNTKTATVGRRAYFALDNGIWLKPVAGDAASPENGVICYNATTHKFRGYANGVWVDLH